MRNGLRRVAIPAVCIAGFALAGFFVGCVFLAPLTGAAIFILFGIAYCWFGYSASDQFVLDIYEARVIEAATSPNLYETMRQLSESVGIEPPLLYSLPYGGPNAMAIARADRSKVIVLTNALMNDLNHDEARAILALMTARLASGNSFADNFAATLAGIPLYLLSNLNFRDVVRQRFKPAKSSGISVVEKCLFCIIVPLCAAITRVAFDRKAYLKADAEAVRLTGSSDFLASALAAIEAAKPGDWWVRTAYNPATALLFAVPPLGSSQLLRGIDPFMARTQEAFAGWMPPLDERHAHFDPVQFRLWSTAESSIAKTV